MIAVESRRPHMSAACLGTETVGYTEPCWVRWSKVVRNGRARFCTACNFARVAAEVRNMSCLSR